MHIHSQGLLSEATYIPSPNQDARPNDKDISLIVIHGISLPPGEFGSDAIHQLFMNSLDPNAHPYFQEIHHLRVSSHCLIRREGSIIQYVPFTQRAWHAGVSSFAGREDCNDYSIGIELEGTDDLPYTLAQYEQLAALITLLRKEYPMIAKENIVGHVDIAPDRKTDPGPSFQWALLTDLMTTYVG